MRNSIKIERARHNITQEELAKKIDVSRQTIHSIETCKFIPSTITALKIAKVFNVNIHDIFELEPTD